MKNSLFALTTKKLTVLVTFILLITPVSHSNTGSQLTSQQTKPYLNAKDIIKLTKEEVERYSNQLILMNETQQLKHISTKNVFVDGRIKLRNCEQPLSIDTLSNKTLAKRIIVRIRCDDIKPWAISVPAEIEIWQEGIVANRHIAKNEIIKKSDFRMEDIRIGSSNQHIGLEPQNVIGKIALRPIAANSPISTRILGKQKLIKRGDNVVIEARIGSINVKMMGEALQDGREDEQILIKNKQSKRQIKAKVTAPGHVMALM